MLKVHRTAIESRRKDLKAPILELGKLVDAEAKRLTAIVEPRELELSADAKAYEDRLEAERKAEEARIAAERAEAERLAREKLQARINAVQELGGAVDLLYLQTAEDDEVESMLTRLRTEKEEREAIAAKEEAERIERERLDAIATAERKQAEEAAAALEAARRPDLEKVREWAAAWIAARPEFPAIADKSIESAMLKAARYVEDNLAAIV